MKKIIETIKKHYAILNISVAIAIVLVFNCGFCMTDGSSMAPTYGENHAVFTISRNLYNKEIERFDIVGIKFEDTPINETHFKRVVGLPGESIQYVNGDIIVNGEYIENPYVTYKYEKGSYDLPYTSFQLGENEYLVLGDNQGLNDDNTASIDSRFYGVITEDNIVKFCFGSI